MSFIIKNSDAFVNAKLTDYGRQLLAAGRLNFRYYTLGDSEIDYESLGADFDLTTNLILRPKDNQPDFRYPILPSPSATEPYANLGSISPIIQTVYNKAKTRGFFSGSTPYYTALTTTTYVRTAGAMLPVSACTGSATATIKKQPGYAAGSPEPQAGDLMTVKFNHPKLAISQAQGAIEPDPVPYLTYKVLSKTGELSGNTLSVTLDRTLPNFNTTGTDFSYVIFYPGGDSINNYYASGTTAAYWNSETLSFEGTCDVAIADVPVLNYTSIFTKPIAGGNSATYESTDDISTAKYAGVKQYLGLGSDMPDQNSIGIIHYTNNNISNHYGERFYIDSVKGYLPTVTLPTLMYHRSDYAGTEGDVIGFTFSADTTERFVTSVYNTKSSLSYYNLIDDGGSYTGDTCFGVTDESIVGRVYPDLRVVVFTNEEIVAALSYKSSRNWTLPKLRGEVVGSTQSRGLLGSTDELYVTYLLNSTDKMNTSLHCLNYQKVSHTQTGTLDARVFFPKSQLKYMRWSGASYDGTGFYANEFKVICQKVTKGSLPTDTGWKVIDHSATALSGGTLHPTLLENGFYTITYDAYTGASTYNLNTYVPQIAIGAGGEQLRFGDEAHFYGNFDTYISAKTYKSNFVLKAEGDRFNTSQNPTHADSGQNVHVTELGVYDADKNLVMVGKLSQPLQKKSGQMLIIELGVDF